MKNVKPAGKTNPAGTMTLNEGLAVLAKKNITVTRMGLKVMAKRDGFVSVDRGGGQSKFLLDSVKFKAWQIKSFSAVPVGYSTIATIAKDFNVSASYVFSLIKRYKLKTKKHGTGRGKILVNVKALNEVIEKIKSRKGKAIAGE